MKVVLPLALMVGASFAELTLPASYTAKVTMTMPYYDLVEPITAWVDAETGLGRLDYWGGVDTYIYNTNGTCYQVRGHDCRVVKMSDLGARVRVGVDAHIYKSFGV